MLKTDKERVVAELVERLRQSDTLIVTDYRGLTMGEIDDVRTKLIEAGARFSVVKNTLARRAAEAADVEPLLDLLEGPTAIAFLEPDSDPVAAAKVLNEVAKHDEDPRDPRRRDGRPHDHRGRRQGARDAPAGRRPPRPGAGRDHRPADRDARPRHARRCRTCTA